MLVSADMWGADPDFRWELVVAWHPWQVHLVEQAAWKAIMADIHADEMAALNAMEYYRPWHPVATFDGLVSDSD